MYQITFRFYLQLGNYNITRYNLEQKKYYVTLILTCILFDNPYNALVLLKQIFIAIYLQWCGQFGQAKHVARNLAATSAGPESGLILAGAD